VVLVTLPILIKHLSVDPKGITIIEFEPNVYSENMGAYCAASSTSFNGFPPAKIVHVNQ
jgi:hypothetical protein